jgi:hypothetical protein
MIIPHLPAHKKSTLPEFHFSIEALRITYRHPTLLSFERSMESEIISIITQLVTDPLPAHSRLEAIQSHPDYPPSLLRILIDSTVNEILRVGAALQVRDLYFQGHDFGLTVPQWMDIIVVSPPRVQLQLRIILDGIISFLISRDEVAHLLSLSEELFPLQPFAAVLILATFLKQLPQSHPAHMSIFQALGLSLPRVCESC